MSFLHLLSRLALLSGLVLIFILPLTSFSASRCEVPSGKASVTLRPKPILERRLVPPPIASAQTWEGSFPPKAPKAHFRPGEARPRTKLASAEFFFLILPWASLSTSCCEVPSGKGSVALISKSILKCRLVPPAVAPAQKWREPLRPKAPGAHFHSREAHASA